MQVLIYTSPFNRSVGMLLETLGNLESSVCSEHITTLPELGMRLRKPMGVPSIGILMPKDDSELSALVNFRHLLRDMRIILVLPDADVSTWKSAHLLRPRYISYGDDDLSDVIAVSSRMIRTLNDVSGNFVHTAAARCPHHPTTH